MLNSGRKLGIATLTLAFLLAGCGGGSDEPASAPQTEPPPSSGNPPPNPAPSPPPPTPGVGSAELSWTPPLENTDGSVLTDLAGYEIRYGQSATNLDQTINITNPSLSTYIVEDLTAGTWYFTVAAVNSAGVRSTPSNVASKTI